METNNRAGGRRFQANRQQQQISYRPCTGHCVITPHENAQRCRHNIRVRTDRPARHTGRNSGQPNSHIHHCSNCNAMGCSLCVGGNPSSQLSRRERRRIRQRNRRARRRAEASGQPNATNGLIGTPLLNISASESSGTSNLIISASESSGTSNVHVENEEIEEQATSSEITVRSEPGVGQRMLERMAELDMEYENARLLMPLPYQAQFLSGLFRPGIRIEVFSCLPVDRPDLTGFSYERIGHCLHRHTRWNREDGQNVVVNVTSSSTSEGIGNVSFQSQNQAAHAGIFGIGATTGFSNGESHSSTRFDGTGHGVAHGSSSRSYHHYDVCTTYIVDNNNNWGLLIAESELMFTLADCQFVERSGVNRFYSGAELYYLRDRGPILGLFQNYLTQFQVTYGISNLDRHLELLQGHPGNRLTLMAPDV